MKLKATKREIKNNNNKILKFGYCEIQYLLNNENPFAYSCGRDGWCCDYYNIDGVILSTGYSPIGTQTDYKIVKKYENKALKMKYTPRFQLRKRNLINKMIKELTGEL